MLVEFAETVVFLLAGVVLLGAVAHVLGWLLARRRTAQFVWRAWNVLGVLLLGLAEVIHHDVRAFAGERDRNRLADARVTAGDDRHAVREPLRPAVRLLAVIGTRLELRLGPGRLLLLLGKWWLRVRGPRVLGRFRCRHGRWSEHGACPGTDAC